MMVAFGPEIFSRQRVGGISRYFCELMREFAGDARSFRLYVPGFENVHLQDLLRSTNVKTKSAAYALPNLWSTLVCDYQAAREAGSDGAISVYHETYYPVLTSMQPRARITTIHDMYDEVLGAGLSARRRSMVKRIAAMRADVIIAVSHATKAHLIDIWNVPEERIHVIHHGIRIENVSNKDAKNTCKIWNSAFFLFVGRREGYKNFNQVLIAYANCCAKRDVDLLCFGSSFSSSEQRRIQSLGLVGRIHAIQGDDQKLDYVYRAALALVYPSSFEGFGFPVLEAMARKCPVITTNRTALFEVAGEAAYFVDPESADDIGLAMDKLTYDHTLRERLISDGLRQAAKFSWKASASAHWGLYQALH